MRDHSGKVIGSFSRSIGVADAKKAEIVAIQQACSLCVNASSLIGKKISIISDSKEAVNWVNGSGYGSLNHVNIIYDIRFNLNILGSTEVIYNPRSSNCFADFLAKKGSSLAGDTMYWEVD